MSHWADYLIRQDEDWKLHCHPWAGQYLVHSLLYGPRRTVEEVLALKEYPLAGLGTPAEAAVLIDVPERVLLFEDVTNVSTLPERVAWFAYLRQAWPGWRVRWAYGKTLELARYAGVDPVEHRRTAAAVLAGSESVLMAPDDPARAWAVVTVVRRDGHVEVHPVEVKGGSRHPGMLGPRLLSALAGGGFEELRMAEMPYVGVHVDEPARGVGWWTTAAWDEAVEELPARWSGWRYDFWQDHFEEQVDRCAGTLALPPIDVVSALSGLADRLHSEVAVCGLCRTGTTCAHADVLAQQWELVTGHLTAARQACVAGQG